MFDIGWVEMMVVVVVMIIVIGPKDLPGVLRTMGRWIAQVRAMARNFQDSIEELAEETGLDKVRDEVRSIRDFRLDEEIEKTIDPEGELREGIDADLEGINIENGAAEGSLDKEGKSPEPASGAADAAKVEEESTPRGDTAEDKVEADNADHGTGAKT